MGSIWDTERLSDLFEVVQPVRGSARIWPQVNVTLEPTVFLFYILPVVHPFISHTSVCPSIHPSIHPLIHSTNIYWARTVYQVNKIHALMGRCKDQPKNHKWVDAAESHGKAALRVGETWVWVLSLPWLNGWPWAKCFTSVYLCLSWVKHSFGLEIDSWDPTPTPHPSPKIL